MTLAFNTNPGGAGTLYTSSSLTKTITSGTVTFDDIKVDKAASGYKLSASTTATGVSATTSQAFTINVGPAVGLSFAANIANAKSLAVISNPIVVNVIDAGANKVTTGTYNITMAIGDDASDGQNASLGGTLSRSTSAGSASFTDLTIDWAGNGYSLDVSDDANILNDGYSSSFNITPGAASKLAFTQDTSQVPQNVSMSPAVKVSILDATGNVVTTATNQITIAFNNGSGTITGGGATSAVAGVATFSSLQFNTVQSNAKLKATATGLTTAVSSAFNVVTNGLQFTTMPVANSITVGQNLTTQPVVRIYNLFDSTTVTSANNTVQLTAYYDSACTSSAGNLTNGSKAAVSGVVTYTTANFTKSGTFYIGASGSNLQSACASSNPVTFVAGTATQIGFSTPPSMNTWNNQTLITSPVVAIQDTYGNAVPSATNQVTIAAFTDSACTTPIANGIFSAGVSQTNAVQGLASFSNLVFSGGTFTAGQASYYLKATSGSWTNCSSKIVVRTHSPIASGTLQSTTCAITAANGYVYCWGYGGNGALGVGSTSNATTPVQVLNHDGISSPAYLQNIISIAVGYQNACAVDTSGYVYCWGKGGYGVNGNNSTLDSYTPVTVLGPDGINPLQNIIQVSVGKSTACAVSTSGSLYCWGNDLSTGLLGNTAITSNLLQKFAKPALTGSGASAITRIVQLSVGSQTACASNDAGTMFCWGFNNQSSLGVHSNASFKTYFPTTNSNYTSPIVQNAFGDSHACDLKRDGTIYCGGSNDLGQLGNGGTGKNWVHGYITSQSSVANISEN